LIQRWSLENDRDYCGNNSISGQEPSLLIKDKTGYTETMRPKKRKGHIIKPKLGSISKERADLRQDLIKEAAKEILSNEDLQ